MKVRLKEWNKNIFRDVKIKVIVVDFFLKNVQNEINSLGYNDSLQDRELKAKHDLDVALNLKDEYWKENTKLKWNLASDRNTKFFHTNARTRRKTNLISTLYIDGLVVTNSITKENHMEIILITCLITKLFCRIQVWFKM